MKNNNNLFVNEGLLVQDSNKINPLTPKVTNA